VTYAGQEHLLAVLDPDPVRADRKCKLLWQKLEFFFRKNRASSPEDLTQEVFVRAKIRISEGQSVFAANPESYFYGIARHILQEDWRHVKSQPVSIPEDGDKCFGSNAEAERLERRLLLESCIRHLDSGDRAFLKAYLRDGPVRAAHAGRVTANACRIRFHRLTIRLRELTKPHCAARNGG
jgi:DNA-directed RNA polymerase specialized sigma24 family protein